jgi:hypothetical protein
MNSHGGVFLLYVKFGVIRREVFIAVAFDQLVHSDEKDYKKTIINGGVMKKFTRKQLYIMNNSISCK